MVCYYTEHIRAEHADFIELMNAVYSTLIDLRFLRPDEVVFPPYNVPGKPSIASSQLEHLGFTDEVIALLGGLPYPTNKLMNNFSRVDEGVPMAPDSFLVSYLEGARMELVKTSRQPFMDGEVGIPAWAFKITTWGNDIGTTYLYDTRLKHCVRWDSQNNYEYIDQPHRSVPESQHILVGELRSLDWLPWRMQFGSVTSLNIYARPTYKQHLSALGSTNRYSVIEGNDCDDEMTPVPESPQDSDDFDWLIGEIHRFAEKVPALQHDIDQASPRTRQDAHKMRALAVAHGVPVPELPAMSCQSYFSPRFTRVNNRLEIARAVQNKYLYKRSIYEACGWPDNFRGDEFEERRRVAEKAHYDLAELLGPKAMHIADIKHGRYLREWYRQRAGVNAV